VKNENPQVIKKTTVNITLNFGSVKALFRFLIPEVNETFFSTLFVKVSLKKNESRIKLIKL